MSKNEKGEISDLYILEFIDTKGEGDLEKQNVYTLYKYKLSDEEIKNFFSTGSEIFEDDPFLNVANLDKIATDFTYEYWEPTDFISEEFFDSDWVGSQMSAHPVHEFKNKIPEEFLIKEELLLDDLTSINGFVHRYDKEDNETWELFINGRCYKKGSVDELFEYDWGYPFNKEFKAENVWSAFGVIMLFCESKSCLYRIDFWGDDAEYSRLDLNKQSDGGYAAVLVSGGTYESSSKILQGTVSSIYQNLRMVAIVALLTILVYVGIRMVLSSAAKDKAKYKQMLMDWLVAFIMLFVLHYIMAFIIDISESLTEICDGSNIENIPIQVPKDTRIYGADGKPSEKLSDEDGVKVWYTNFMGMLRFRAGLVHFKGYTMKGIVNSIMYIVIIIYTVIFTFQYLRRVLYMAFLTMISPLVAITYPLDKLSDGKAQGFNMWLKEYIFNALLQPIHYIIYVVIMGSVMALVVDYPAYALVALGFMVPAEKFIRKMFGFEKAGTVSAFGGAAGAAMLMGGLQKLRGPHGGKGGGHGGPDGKENKPNTKIRNIDAIESGTDADKNPLNNNGESSWHSKLTAEQKDEAMSRGIYEPAGSEYEQFLAERGLKPETNSANGNNANNIQNALKSSNPSISGRRGGIGAGLQGIGGYYSRRLLNASKKAKPIRALRRAATYGIGAATLGAIGLAAGIASGDPTKAFQYTMAGGAVGGSVGRGLGDTASDLVGLEGAANSFKAGLLGDEYAEYERLGANREFKTDLKNYETATKKVGRDGWKEMNKSGGIVDEALEYGINDVGVMCNIQKTKEKLQSNGMNEKDAQDFAFKAYKLSQKYGDYSSNSKTLENLRKVLKEKGSTNQEPMIKNLIKIYNDISMD